MPRRSRSVTTTEPSANSRPPSMHREQHRARRGQPVTRAHRHLPSARCVRRPDPGSAIDVGAPTGGPVVHLLGDLDRPVLLRHPALGGVVRIDVPLAVPKVRGARRSANRADAPEPDRSGARARRPSRRPSATVLLFDFGAVARYTTAWARLSCASGSPTYSTACAAAVASGSASGSAMPDVLGGQDHEPAGDEAGVLAGLEHAGEPVERRRRRPSRGCS